jgi:hypothetical protein
MSGLNMKTAGVFLPLFKAISVQRRAWRTRRRA